MVKCGIWNEYSYVIYRWYIYYNVQAIKWMPYHVHVYIILLGSGSGYHPVTLCLYQDQLIRRVDPQKRSLATFFEDEFAKKLGECTLHLSFFIQILFIIYWIIEVLFVKLYRTLFWVKYILPSCFKWYSINVINGIICNHL